MKSSFILNGKWLTQSLTGTQRHAQEITKVLLSIRNDILVAVPRDAVIPDWIPENLVIRGMMKGTLFEQLELPFIGRRGHIVNLVGSSPVLATGQVIVIHDASVFRYPRTFSKRFVAFYRLQMKTAKRRSRLLITDSEFSKRELETFIELGDRKIEVVYCGSDHISSEINRSIPENQVVVIGSLAPRKNLLQVVPALAEAGYLVRVVGASGSKRIFGSSKTPENWTSDNIKLMGRLSDNEVIDELKRSIALIFPSLYEGFGLPLVEAQATGTPVVCSSAASLTEIGQDSALYFDPLSHKDAVIQVNRLKFDSQLREEIISKGLENVKRFQWHQAGAEYSQLFDEYFK